MLGERASAGGARFDLLWLSGFSHATMMGLPDAEPAPSASRLEMVGAIAARTNLPLLADGDTGGDTPTFCVLCRKLEEMGVSGVVVEDKCGAKRTSLADNVHHDLEDPEAFAAKINAAKAAIGSELMIFARTEALIAGAGQTEALSRARRYIQSRADGIVIHSKDKTGKDVFAFMDAYKALQSELNLRKPLICIPTAYHHVTVGELHARGAAIVIHGNQMIRAAYQAMQKTAEAILKTGRSLEADAEITPVAEIIDLLGTG